MNEMIEQKENTDKDIIKLIERKKEKIDVDTMSPLIWAYVGDSVYELYVRTHLTNITKLKSHQLHMKAIQYVKAGAQANILEGLMEYLTQQEQEIVRRGRNAESHHLPKNATVQEYMYSTAFEALIGYLYLTKQDERLSEILQKVLELVK